LTIVTRGFSENMAHAVLYAVDKPEPAAGQIYNCGDVHQYTVAQWIEYVASLMDWEFKMVSVPNAYASPAWENIPFRGSTHQQMLDLHKIRAELGYVDRIPAPEAVRQTVEHFRANPPDLGAAFEAELRHHYDIEDKLVDLAEQCYGQMAKLPHIEQDYHHAYAHPKAPGLERDHRDR
jgi:dTDP-D-glucose 4,6-dehydratase